MELCQARGSWGLGTGAASEGGRALEQAAQGTSESPMLMMFNKNLENTLSYMFNYQIALHEARR